MAVKTPMPSMLDCRQLGPLRSSLIFGMLVA